MNRLLKSVRSILFEHIGWKLLSLVIAVAIWALVASEPELSTFATVPLEFRNLPDDVEITSELISTVRLELRGSSGELRGIGDGGLRPAVVLDMSNVQPGVRSFPITGANVRLSRGVRVVGAVPAEVRFHFEKRMVRVVPVVVRVSGEGQNGYQVVQTTAEPAEESIVGPADRVSRIKAVETDPIDVSNIYGLSRVHVNAYADDPYVRFQASPQVVVTVVMKKK